MNLQYPSSIQFSNPYHRNLGFSITIYLLIGLTGCATNNAPQKIPDNSHPQQSAAPVTPDPGPSSRPGQCKVIRRAEYEDVLKLNLVGKRYATFSKLRNDVKPAGPYKVQTIQFLVDRGQWGVILINGIALDTADVMLEISQGSFLNLTNLISFPSCKGRITDIQRVIYLPTQAN
jgi:hypothetical protein